jgi:hypothetical protein
MINASRLALFLVSGKRKASALGSRNESLPWRRVVPWGRLLILADRAAAMA